MSAPIVQGYEQLQVAAQKLLEAVKPSGGLGKAVVYATGEYQKGVQGRAHVDTGTYKSSITPDVQGLTGRVYTAANRNPRSGASASTYGPYEEARGGSHAAYGATYREESPAIAARAIELVMGDLP